MQYDTEFLIVCILNAALLGLITNIKTWELTASPIFYSWYYFSESLRRPLQDLFRFLISLTSIESHFLYMFFRLIVLPTRLSFIHSETILILMQYSICFVKTVQSCNIYRKNFTKCLYTRHGLNTIQPCKPQKDWHLISPYNITAKSNIKVMRIKEMISMYRGSWWLNKIFLSAPEEMYGEQYGEYTDWCYGVEGDNTLWT